MIKADRRLFRFTRLRLSARAAGGGGRGAEWRDHDFQTRAFGRCSRQQSSWGKSQVGLQKKNPSVLCVTPVCNTCVNHAEEPLLSLRELPHLSCPDPHTSRLRVSPGDTVNKQVRAEELGLDICPSPTAGSQDEFFCHPEVFGDFPVTQPSQYSLQWLSQCMNKQPGITLRFKASRLVPKQTSHFQAWFAGLLNDPYSHEE